MCGIAGFFHFEKDRPANAAVLKQMTDVIAHRGPDGEGFHVQQNVALGHRRLAIIDLNTGEQPMYSHDQQIVVVFNGEIYNYVELREELIQLGARFTTTSDTEVIIHAYRTWGVDCQKRFNGMWAFALWDEAKQRLFISRDRLGEKPLYYAVHDQSFVFGSEIKAVLAYGVPAQPRLEMTALYLALSFLPAPYTYYQYVQQLLPGKFLLIDENGITEKTYWDLPDITEKDLTKDKARVETEFEHLFHDSIRIRMRSDVAFGAFLSGGLDSSCVVSAMANHTSKPVQTFTMGFENKQYDERNLAQLVADRYHTDHHVGIVSSEHFEAALEKVLLQYDEPFGDASAIPTGHISKYAAEYVKMVLTGDGGDEVLSGYTTFQGEKFAAQYQRFPAFVRKSLPALAQLSARPLRGSLRYKLNRVSKVLQASNLPFEQRLLNKLAHTAPENIASILQPGLKTLSFFEFYNEAMKGCRFTDPFYKLVYFQHKVTLPGDMLTKVDRMSMGYSIETRIPFLDHRIVELLYGVDKSVKTKGYINKIILRNAVANKALPPELLDARKKGFTVPLRDWFKEEFLDQKIRKILLSNPGTIFNAGSIEKLIDQNKKGEFDIGNFIWMLTVLKSWMDKSRQSRDLPVVTENAA